MRVRVFSFYGIVGMNLMNREAEVEVGV